MHDSPSPGESQNNGLDLQAFLYATGELDAAEASAFEQRLEQDQTAREALCQAVQLSLTLTQQMPARPDPAYRDRVRARLQRRGWGWLVGRRTYRGHPAVWSAVGAAAAVLLVMALAQLPVMTTHAHPPLPSPAEPQEEAIPGPIIEPPQVAANVDVANTWASLHNTTRVTKAHEEEMRRKQRAAKPSDRRPRPAVNMAPE